MGSFFSSLWQTVKYPFDTSGDINSIKKDGQQIGTNVQTTVTNTVDTVQGLLPTIKNDLDWLLIAIVGIGVYVFIFKR